MGSWRVNQQSGQQGFGAALLLAVLLASLLIVIPGWPGAEPAPAAAALDTPVTGLFLDGEAGAPVTSGNSYTFSNAVVSGSASMIWVSASDATHSYSFGLGVPFGQTLTIGTYQFTQGYPSPGQNGMNLSGDSVGCSGYGSFTIDEIQRAQNDQPTVVALRFEHHCTGFEAAVFGSLAYNASAGFWRRTMSTNAMQFGSVRAGETGEPQIVTVANVGPSPLGVSAVAVTGTNASEFSVPLTDCQGATLSVGQTCTIVAAFAPSTATPGARSARLTIFDDLLTGGSGRDVLLLGTAVTARGEFLPVTPARILDTRDGTGGRLGPLGWTETQPVQITGQGGIPASGVAAVVMNVTVTGPTSNGFLTVWPKGVARPVLSNLNFSPGKTVPNLVTVAVGTGGQVDVFNSAGSTHVIVDVVGYYASSDGPAGSRFHDVTPYRFFDTRTGQGGVGVGPVGPVGVKHFKVTGVGGVPASGVTAVVMNVTVTEPTGAGFVTAYPADVTRPLASNLNFVPQQTVPNLVTVRVPADGYVDFFNSAGATHVLADVVGYYDGDKTTEAGRFVGITPARTYDSRDWDEPLGPSEYLVLDMAGYDGIPSSGAGSVVMNVTVTEPTAPGFLTVFPDNACDLPGASNLNFVAGQTVPNLVIAGLSTFTGCAVSEGAVDIFNSSGVTHVIVDLFGYFTDGSATGFAATGTAGSSSGPRWQRGSRKTSALIG